MPRVDLALVLACLVVFGMLSVLHLALRPELRKGRKVSRMWSYAAGSEVDPDGAAFGARWGAGDALAGAAG